MHSVLEGIRLYLDAIWQAITHALAFDPRLLQIVEAAPESSWIILSVAILAGISQLLGQSVTLFANQVPPARFAWSLLLNGFIFAFSLVFWALTIWVVGRYGFGVSQAPTIVLRLVALSSAPYVFGFFILMPYAGAAFGRLLAVWSFVIALRAVMFTLRLDFWQALLCISLGWLLMQCLSLTIGRPVLLLRDWLLRRMAGTQLTRRADDILAVFETRPSDSQPPQPGGTA